MPRFAINGLSRLLLLALAPVFALSAGVAHAAATSDPWAALEQVRGKLAAGGPRAADFEHVYVPAGFSQGEKETGRMSLSLPDCLRWDYREPYPKSFLLCGNVAYYWNPGETTGRRQTINSRQEPGLDLLLLPVKDLRSRYQGTVETLADGQVRIHLVPSQPLPEVKEATLTLDIGAGVVSGLEYTDGEGNHTRFAITSYGPLAATGLFAPPGEIAWEEGPEP